MKKKNIMLIAFLLVMTLVLAGCQESDKSKYEKAQSMMAKGQYAEAGATFAELGSYEDSAKLTMYCKAAAAGESGDYETATSTFALLGDYKESSFMIPYYNARQMESDAEKDAYYYWYVEAAEAYDAITLFRDSAERAESCRKKAYDAAVEAAEKGDLSSIDLFSQLSDYKDSKQLYAYYNAFSLEAMGLYSEASDEFAKLGEFKDAKEQAGLVKKRCQDDSAALVASGDDLLAKGGWDAALEAYNSAIRRCYSPEDSLDISNEKIPNVYYQKGLSLLAKKKWDEAVTAFSSARDYSDAKVKIQETRYAEGIDKRDQHNWEGAKIAFFLAGDYLDSSDQINATRYAEAEYLLGENKKEEAADAFRLIGDYKDSTERADQLYDVIGDEYLADQQWDKAITAYMKGSFGKNLNDQNDKVSEVYYTKGETLLNEKKYKEATEVFEKIAGYKDSSEKLKETLLLLGDEYLKNEEWDLAVDSYNKAEGPTETSEDIIDAGSVCSASAEGFAGDVSVMVTFDHSGAISSLTVNAENELLGKDCEKKEFTDQFIGKMPPFSLGDGIDACSGATITSKTVIDAINRIEPVKKAIVLSDKAKEAYYLQANSLKKEGKLADAYEKYQMIKGYKDVDEILSNSEGWGKKYTVSKENTFSVITVSVVMLENDILECEIKSESENGADLLSEEIKQAWAKAIVEADTAETDAITGATLSFSAQSVREAVEEILESNGV